MSRRAPDPDAAFEAYLRRHRSRQVPTLDLGRALPAEWAGKPRRRAERPPPDLSAEAEAQLLAWAEIHTALVTPRLADVKRLAKGRIAHLVVGRDGTAVMIVTGRDGRVVRVAGEREFNETQEVI